MDYGIHANLVHTYTVHTVSYVKNSLAWNWVATLISIYFNNWQVSGLVNTQNSKKKLSELVALKYCNTPDYVLQITK